MSTAWIGFKKYFRILSHQTSQLLCLMWGNMKIFLEMQSVMGWIFAKTMNSYCTRCRALCLQSGSTVLARMSEKINVIWDLKCPWNWRRVGRKALFFLENKVNYLCVTAIWIARCCLYTDQHATSSAVLTCWKSVFGTLVCFEKCVLYFTQKTLSINPTKCRQRNVHAQCQKWKRVSALRPPRDIAAKHSLVTCQ